MTHSCKIHSCGIWVKLDRSATLNNVFVKILETIEISTVLFVNCDYSDFVFENYRNKDTTRIDIFLLANENIYIIYLVLVLNFSKLFFVFFNSMNKNELIDFETRNSLIQRLCVFENFIFLTH